MLDWGAENIEQSIRTWLCGGDILAVRTSTVGHIFDRPANPHKVRPGAVQTNNARAAFMWLDDYVTAHTDAGGAGLDTINSVGNLDAQLMKRRSDRCRPFSHFMQLFRQTFDQRGLFVHNMHHLRESTTGLCLEGIGDKANAKEAKAEGNITLAPCSMGSSNQRWSIVADGNRILNQYTGKCLDAGGRAFDGTAPPILYVCTFGKKDANLNQSWKFVGAPGPLRRSNAVYSDGHRGAVGYLAQVPSGATNKGMQPLKPANSDGGTQTGCVGETGRLVDCAKRATLEWIW